MAGSDFTRVNPLPGVAAAGPATPPDLDRFEGVLVELDSLEALRADLAHGGSAYIEPTGQLVAGEPVYRRRDPDSVTPA